MGNLPNPPCSEDPAHRGAVDEVAAPMTMISRRKPCPNLTSRPAWASGNVRCPSGCPTDLGIACDGSPATKRIVCMAGTCKAVFQLVELETLEAVRYQPVLIHRAIPPRLSRSADPPNRQLPMCRGLRRFGRCLGLPQTRFTGLQAGVCAGTAPRLPPIRSFP